MYEKHYSHFLEANSGKFHFAAHSHHFWPDVTKKAQEQYWLDCAKYVDDKWNYFFSNIVPKTKKHIAKIVNFSREEDISFAPNTHELAFRLLSCLDQQKDLKILTTDCEFHSFSRQLDRVNELSNITVTKVPSKDLITSLENNTYDFIFISQVFFNTGEILPWNLIQKISKLKKNALLCVDGYHAFAAIPTDISSIENDIFYLGGSYKYAQGGEGLCFMTIPKDCKLRPLNTGWFSSFSTLEKSNQDVHYDDKGMRFWGSTQDMTAFYRFNATWDLFEKENITVDVKHEYIKKLQAHWIDRFKSSCPVDCLNSDLTAIGHFLTYQFKDANQVKAYYSWAKEHGVIFDYRNNNLRIGFGSYQSINYVDDALDILST